NSCPAGSRHCWRHRRKVKPMRLHYGGPKHHQEEPMTLTTTPIAANTTSGAPLPLVALPQGKLLTVNARNIPLIENALGPGVHFQPLRVDVEAGVWVVLATFSPGSMVPLHYHTGVAEVYTLAGSWH